MRLHCIFVACFVLFALCSLANSEAAQGPDKCCFSFSNVRIPVKQVAAYHITHLECRGRGIIFVTNVGKEICTDLNEKWVQRLKNMVDARNLKETETSTEKSV
nr:C-C motif chemokine 13-like [Misgurnus anguillicaudatus]